MAPFISGGGYCSEAWSYILALNKYKNNTNSFKLSIDQHGDGENFDFWDGLSLDVKYLANELYRNECRLNESIVICHSEPGAWDPALYQTSRCPPGRSRFVVGRTMFETDRVNAEHVRRCNVMDMVWVPSEFHVSSFVKSGVDKEKVVKVVQAVDTEFFDPMKYDSIKIESLGKLVLGSGLVGLDGRKAFVFLSVFKWEFRKGWDVLLRSYLQEFDSLDGVCLYLLTNPYHSDSDFGNKIVEYVVDAKLAIPVNGWAPVYVIDSHIAQVDFPKLYKAADAFVLPSRGEGWGRPIVEAMAMSLPVIATNWSGPTEYLTEENSYPLPVDRMSEVTDGPFKGHLWAEPSVDKLRFLMRHVVSNPEEAKSKGKKAREDMINKFSPKIVANIVFDQMQRILERIA
ncbi:glycosyl transferase, family 1 protein [Tanacetum coccineum]